MKRQSRLEFSQEELVIPELETTISYSQKMANKLDKAERKIPKKKVLKQERMLDKSTGKSKVRLKFEEVDKAKPISKLQHAKKVAPARAALNDIHKNVGATEEDNISLKAVHRTEQGAEFTGKTIGSIYRTNRRYQYKRLERAQHKSIKADANYYYAKNNLDNPNTTTNPISKVQQKKAIKKAYMAKYYTNEQKVKTVSHTATDMTTSVKSVSVIALKIVENFVRNPKILFTIAILCIMTMATVAMFASSNILLQGAISQVLSTSYTSDNEELLSINNNFTQLETALEYRLNNMEDEYEGYDEYNYELDSIAHDPHQLAAYLTAVNLYFTASEMQSVIEGLFNIMYNLTVTEEVEVRYRVAITDSEGNIINWEDAQEDTEGAQSYEYKILTVGLISKSVEDVVSSTLTAEQLQMYYVYRETLGNKPLLFGGGSSDDTPSTDLTGVVFVGGERIGNQEIVEIAMSQVGNEGGQPYWSWYGFSSRVEWCATFVSWVFYQAGYSEPRFAACQNQGIAYFTSNGRFASRGYEQIAAGDVIFFDWNRDNHSDHVGIVIGTDGSKVYTVEGNSGDACKVKSYDLNSSVIMGYGLMN